MAATQHILVIGNGMVGHHFVEQLRKNEPSAIITVLCGEPQLAYDRVYLSSVFSGTTKAELALTTEQHYQQQGIAYQLNCWVTRIEPQSKTVFTASGDNYHYDKLVLATGSYPFVPPIPGAAQPHCLVYRTLADLDEIAKSAKQSQTGVVIGGGLLGLEAANALRQLGLTTHVVEFAPQLMAVQLDSAGGALLQQKISAMGLGVHIGKNTTAIVAGSECRYRLEFADGSALETDLILFSAGIRPHDSLAQQAGLHCGPRGGIVINDTCQSSNPDIYAIGECAVWQNQIFGLVAPGYQMARVAASHLSGQQHYFQGADMSTRLKLLGIDVGSIGDAHARTPGAQSLIFQDPIRQHYKKLILNDSGDKLLGAVLVGDTAEYDTLLQYYLNDMTLPSAPECLILPQAEQGSATLTPDKLPNSAMLCSCHNVTKGDVVSCIDQGQLELASIKSCTKASTGCGGCAALLKSVVDAELQVRGIAINQHLCEHFAYSRQELLHLVQVEQITSFAQLLSSHGRGLGCDICKPTIASILASVWNEYVLDQKHVALQDTNDTFLANMQKDGSYSIVPRIAGGEISSAKLLALAQVADDYQLYCKITGGQRIDLFGARLEQLPLIWRRLVDAGFETGHAYGKSLRTVKSCVGSTWCRYGVQDSVGQAIAIESRYKGLRSPHKIKMAVSGCTRECAEAQSKDIGVIATEKGWNLYVCGNGGMRPRHADLFAMDLDTATLIQYIDRILIFYIRTADRLQRTSVWLEKLDGGLAYLQDVIINDSLGLAAELEQQMAGLIGSYACEWRRTLEDPEALKRFRHFVNSPQADSNILFVQERGQIRPATSDEKQQYQQQEQRIPVQVIETQEVNHEVV